MTITPTHWEEFQHYKNRRPPWIKLYRSMTIDNPSFLRLPDASKALATCLWMLASEYENGKITLSPEDVAFRLHMPIENFLAAIKPLISANFFKSASITLAACEQDASNMLDQRERRERETEREKEKEDRVLPASKMLAGDGGYVFERGIVRLNAKTMAEWEAAFTDLNLRAELEGLTEWAAKQGKNWFFALKGALAKRNREVRLQKDAVRAGVEVATRRPVTGGGFA